MRTFASSRLNWGPFHNRDNANNSTNCSLVNFSDSLESVRFSWFAESMKKELIGRIHIVLGYKLIKMLLYKIVNYKCHVCATGPSCSQLNARIVAGRKNKSKGTILYCIVRRIQLNLKIKMLEK